MKKFIVAIFSTLIFINTIHAIAQSPESVNNDGLKGTASKEQIDKELRQLRDSIYQTLAEINVKIINATPEIKTKLNQAAKELRWQHEKTEKNLEEVAYAVRTGWTDKAIVRINNTTTEVRSEYQRIRKDDVRYALAGI